MNHRPLANALLAASLLAVTLAAAPGTNALNAIDACAGTDGLAESLATTMDPCQTVQDCTGKDGCATVTIDPVDLCGNTLCDTVNDCLDEAGVGVTVDPALGDSAFSDSASKGYFDPDCSVAAPTPGLSSVNAGLVWTNACQGTLTDQTEYTKVEGALIDTPIIDFVKISYTHVEHKTSFKYSCNVDVNAVATGFGGVSRDVFLYVNGVIASSCTYTGITPSTSCQAATTSGAAGPAGSGNLGDDGGDLPSSVNVCFIPAVRGENHQAPIGIDVVTDAVSDYCADLGIQYHWANTGAIVDLLNL